MRIERSLAHALAFLTLGCTTYHAVPGDGGTDAAGGASGTMDGGDALPPVDGSADRAPGDGGGDHPSGDGGGDSGVTNQCQDGVRDGNETDVDCGGNSCPKCARDQACSADGDCKTGTCVRFFCALASSPPSWVAGPSLNVGRGLGSLGVEPLPGRQALMVAIGGRDDTDPTPSGSYETLETATTPLQWSAASGLPPGMIGYGEPTATDSLGRVVTFSIDGMWIYTGNTLWQTSTAAIPNPRDEAGAALAPNGIAYLVGGSLQRFSAGTGIIEGYDAVANNWKTGLAAMPTARTSLACATGGDGRIYAIGGQTSGSNGTITTVGTVEAYNPTTNTWASLSELPDPAWELAAAGGPDGRVYAIGGVGTAANLSTVNAYSAVSNRWSPVAPLDSGRFGVAAAVAPDGHIWAVGGSTNPELDGFKTVLIYGPTVAVTPTAAAAGGMAAVSGNNFAANATVSVYFGSTTTAPVATGTTNATGALTAAISFRVPNLAAGDQALVVMDDRSQYPITLSFRVQ